MPAAVAVDEDRFAAVAVLPSPGEHLDQPEFGQTSRSIHITSGKNLYFDNSSLQISGQNPLPLLFYWSIFSFKVFTIFCEHICRIHAHMDQAHISVSKCVAGLHEEELDVTPLLGRSHRIVMATQDTRRRSDKQLSFNPQIFPFHQTSNLTRRKSNKQLSLNLKILNIKHQTHQ